jgi:uncharacterized protein HemX
MNNTGKSLAALILLVSILALGWWAVQKRPLLPGVFGPSSTSPLSGSTGVMGEALRSDSSPVTSDLTPDPLLLAEIDASLQWVAQVLAATGNISSAISMLNVLEHRIARLDPQGRVSGLRKAIIADRQSLQAASMEDPLSFVAKIDQLLLQIDQLPLVSSAPPVPAAIASKPDQAQGAVVQAQPLWAAFWSDMKNRLLDVVQIRRVDSPDAFFMTPEQGALVAERLRLRLFSARTALLTRQEALFAQDMMVAEKLLNQVFDASAPEVAATKAALLSIQAAGSAFKVPALTQSLSEIKRLRPTSQAALE